MVRSISSAIGVIVMLLVCTFAVSAQSRIAEFSGNGTKNTTPFNVPDGWEFHWISNGDIFQAFLYSEPGDLVNVIANQSGPGPGPSYVAKGGVYYVQINAIGSWTAYVAKFSRSATTSGAVDFAGTGAENTRPFTMNGPWSVKWSSAGQFFQIFLFSGAGAFVDVLANQSPGSNGSSFEPHGGTYYFQVNASGPWKITTFQRT